MANKDWYYDQFDVEQKGGGFDLSDEQTSALDDLSDEDAAEYESRFIDELYGTDNRQTIIDGENRELTREAWVSTRYDDRAAIARGDVEVHWGLDLRRTMKDEDGDTITINHKDYYKHITRGNIDWASYRKDKAFSKAMKDIGQNVSKLDDDDYSVKERVEWIREANESMGSKDDDKDTRTEPTGEYDPDKITTKLVYNKKGEEIGRDLFIDGKRQKTLSDLYNTTDADGFKKGRLNVGFTYIRKDEDGNDVKVTVGDRGEDVTGNFFDPVAGPPSVVVKPNIKIRDVQVKVPDSLKQWKSDAKKTLKVGGNR